MTYGWSFAWIWWQPYHTILIMEMLDKDCGYKYWACWIWLWLKSVVREDHNHSGIDPMLPNPTMWVHRGGAKYISLTFLLHSRIRMLLCSCPRLFTNASETQGGKHIKPHHSDQTIVRNRSGLPLHTHTHRGRGGGVNSYREYKEG